jgi:hypothetical protein
MTFLRQRVLIGAAGLAVAWCGLASAEAPPSATTPVDFQDIELIWCFQGKGSSLFYDAGVASAAARHLTALGEGRVIVTGNSSGSIWAAYFACRGFGDEAIQHLRHTASRCDLAAIRQSEDIATKVTRLLTNQATEMSPDVLREAVAVALGVDDWRDCPDIQAIVKRSNWRPNHAFVIVAANHDVLGANPLTNASRPRIFDRDTYSVRWSDAAYAAYRKDPERFAREHPDRELGDTPHIGKACTYFCDERTHALLALIPYGERLADLRVVRDAGDIAVAIQASLAEPTYFHPLVEPDPAKLTASNEGAMRAHGHKRTYCGGFIMPVVAQDLRRMLPATHVVGTGWIGVPFSARRYLDQRFGIDVQDLHHRGNWWLDVELRPSSGTERQIIGRRMSPVEEFEVAEREAAIQFGRDGTPPLFVREPMLSWPAREAVQPRGVALAKPVSIGDPVPLPTQRGFGPLVQRLEPEPF